MGKFPGAEKRCPLEIKIEEEVDNGDHVRRLLTYQSEPGSRTPAYLLLPKTAATAPAGLLPAVLCLHPTNLELGHQVVVKSGITENRAYGLELVRRGFVVIAPAYPLMANYQPDLGKLRYASGTMKAIWDNVRALDLLETLPFVKRDGFGAIGHSLGGHNAIFTAVWEPRVKVVITSCGFDSFRDYYGGDQRNWQQGRGWTQERYMPRLASYAGKLRTVPFDFDELLAAIAPRRVFINAPTGDGNFQASSVDRLVTAARPIFALLGNPGALEVEHPESGHDFPEAMRERAYSILDKELR
jgi:dienelactone hydrolase